MKDCAPPSSEEEGGEVGVPVAFLVLILLRGPVVSAIGKFTGFLASLHWPAGPEDIGHIGVSYLDVLILFERRAGHRLLSETVTHPHARAHGPISISSVLVSEGIVIRQGCRFISCLIRALGEIPCGSGSFLPCQVGSHMSRLPHLGWEQCSHCLPARPLETCHH